MVLVLLANFVFENLTRSYYNAPNLQTGNTNWGNFAPGCFRNPHSFNFIVPSDWPPPVKYLKKNESKSIVSHCVSRGAGSVGRSVGRLERPVFGLLNRALLRTLASKKVPILVPNLCGVKHCGSSPIWIKSSIYHYYYQKPMGVKCWNQSKMQRSFIKQEK